MFCQNCGAQLADDVRFCGSCGAPVSSQPNGEAASSTYVPGTAQDTVQQSSAQGEYTQQTQSTQQSYNAQQPYNAQQSYSSQQSGGTQRPVSYGVTRPRRRFTTASVIGLIGAALTIAGFFLPLISYYGVGVSLFELCFGTGMASYYGAAYIPLVAFLVAGGLAVLFAFIKPGLTIISAILGLGGFGYLMFGMGGSMGSVISSLFQYGGIGLYLTLAGVVVLIVGSIMGMIRKK